MRTYALLAPMFITTALAQTPGVDHWSQQDLLAKMPLLEQKAQPSGSASIPLEHYPGYFTMLALREKSGGAELHQNFDDVFYIVRGHATLITAGSIADAKTTAPGETVGTRVDGGTRTSLQPGDFVRIPAGVSHQLLLPAGSEMLLYYVMRVQQK